MSIQGNKRRHRQRKESCDQVNHFDVRLYEIEIILHLPLHVESGRELLSPSAESDENCWAFACFNFIQKCVDLINDLAIPRVVGSVQDHVEYVTILDKTDRWIFLLVDLSDHFSE